MDDRWKLPLYTGVAGEREREREGTVAKKRSKYKIGRKPFTASSVIDGPVAFTENQRSRKLSRTGGKEAER